MSNTNLRARLNSWRMLSLTGSSVIVLLSNTPAFAPPPPPPPKWHPPTSQDLAAIPHLVGHWKNSQDAVGREDCYNYPATLDITTADANHIVMAGQQMNVTRVRVYENTRLGIDIDTPPNGFRILSSGDMMYFPLAGPSYCRFVRDLTP